jgi:hypothetical protein
LVTVFELPAEASGVKKPVVRELRAVQRFTVNLPVVLNWRAPGRPNRPVQGFTRDISTRGMFVLSDPGPIPGELLEFEIDLALDESAPLILVEGEGRVVRVESQPPPSAHPSGFAVHNLWFKLREPEEGQAIAPKVQARAAADVRVSAQAGGRRGLAIVPRPDKAASHGGELK